MSLTLLGCALPIGNLSLRLRGRALETFGKVREILKAADRGGAHPRALSRISYTKFILLHHWPSRSQE